MNAVKYEKRSWEYVTVKMSKSEITAIINVFDDVETYGIKREYRISPLLEKEKAILSDLKSIRDV